MLFIGRAQEKTALFRTERRRDAHGVSYPWIVKTTGVVRTWTPRCTIWRGWWRRGRPPVHRRSLVVHVHLVTAPRYNAVITAIDAALVGRDYYHPQRPRRRTIPRRVRALRLVANHLRDPRTPGNQVEPGTATLAARFRESATRLERFHRLCAMSREIAERFDDLASWTSPSSSR